MRELDSLVDGWPVISPLLDEALALPAAARCHVLCGEMRWPSGCAVSATFWPRRNRRCYACAGRLAGGCLMSHASLPSR